MPLFKLRTFLYLSFHAIGFLFVLISIMGIPGDMGPEKRVVKFLMKLLDFLFPVAWAGIPILLVAAVIAFYFDYAFAGKLCSIVSLSLGLALFLTMIVLHYFA
jgi:hypothetical protein